MPKTLDFRTYLAVEHALISRLVQHWEEQAEPVLKTIADLCRAHEWDKARLLARNLDLYKSGAENREWIKYQLRSMAIFGAGLIAAEKPSFVGTGNFDDTLNRVTATMIQYLEVSATQQVQAEVLQLIAEDEAKSKVQKREHAYGIVMIEVPDDNSAAATINEARKQIADSDLMGDGKDVDGNHVTIRYGLRGEAPDALRDYLRSQDPFEVRVLGLDFFPASEFSGGAVPVIARLATTDLKPLHDGVETLADFKESSFPDYKPHITIAYIKPEAVKKYKKLYVDGSFIVRNATIGHQFGVKEVVPFGMTRKSNPYHDAEGKFTSKEHARQVTDNDFEAWNVYEQSLDASQKLAVQQYSGGHFDRINAALRQNPDLLQHGKGWEADTARSLQKAVLKAPPLHGIVVYRGQTLMDLKEGQEFTLPGFTSTSRRKEVAEKFSKWEDSMLLEIHAEQGLSIAGGEAEMLLPHNSRFKVVSVKGRVAQVRQLTSVVKADKTGRFVTQHVSFDQTGNDKLQLIASLNASRLATWGFTAEAEVRGIQKYKLKAILDGRTSKFCQMINGRTFDVADARTKVLEVLQVQDPEDLKTIQPWPKQTKDALKEYRTLSSQELTERGLHIPPFHAKCRTICVPVGEPTAQVPLIPQEASKQVITVDTLKELGITATQQQVDRWNAYIGLSPVELLAKLVGKTPTELLAGLGKNTIQFLETGDIGLKAQGVSGPLKYAVNSIIDPFTGTIYLSQADFVAAHPGQEAFFLKRLLYTLIETGEQTAAHSLVIKLEGNVFEYVKAGFLPKPDDWQIMRAQMQAELSNGDLKSFYESLPADERLLIDHLLNDNDEHALNALASLNIHYEGKSLGEWLLQGVHGEFILDVNDPLTVSQAKEYLQ